jgi:hypothetical protein
MAPVERVKESMAAVRTASVFWKGRRTVRQAVAA